MMSKMLVYDRVPGGLAQMERFASAFAFGSECTVIRCQIPGLPHLRKQLAAGLPADVGVARQTKSEVGRLGARFRMAARCVKIEADDPLLAHVSNQNQRPSTHRRSRERRARWREV